MPYPLLRCLNATSDQALQPQLNPASVFKYFDSQDGVWKSQKSLYHAPTYLV